MLANHKNMDIEELNKQMSFFQNEYTHNQSVNFPPPLETLIETTQVKRPTRTTGSHRNDINDKMAQIKMNQPMMMAPNQFQTPTLAQPTLAQHTRNNSQYQNQDTSLRTQSQNNPLSSYFQQNYNTLNNVNNKNQQTIQTSVEQFNMPNNMPDNTHTGGQSFINPNNLPILTQSPMQSLSQEQQPGTGYHRMDEKRIDYRQNMNNKVGDFIFDNPNAARYNPQQVAHNPNGYAKDTRMVIQDSSKDIYRQEANSRMAQYSPLARASHVPCNIANMSVNDFYSNMNAGNAGNAGKSENSSNQYQNAEEDARAVLNARIGAYLPLAKAGPLVKPKNWQDNNVNRVNPLVAHDELPIISHD